MRLRACVGCLGPGTSRAGSQNLGSLLVSYWPLAAGFQNLSSQAERGQRIIFREREEWSPILAWHWRGSGIYFAFGVNGYLAGLVSLQQ